jgi:hypothetical protein
MAYGSQNTINYFKAYQNYFWRWAEHGRVIEFANQKTICYREELYNILNELPKTTSLSLGTILLILCACKDNWEVLYGAKQALLSIGYSRMEDNITVEDPYNDLKIQAYQFLCIINQLPQEYRSEMNRSLLLQSVFDSLNVKGYHMGLLPDLKEFNSGEADEAIFGEEAELKSGNLIQDLAPLAAALSVFKDVDALLLKQRTGLTEVPKPIVLPVPEPEGAGLLEQLENDDKTRTLSLLAKRIMAALSIPMYLNGSSEQSLGGISDIANKGTYDKLLLSELAQEDLLLIARLANSEALFLKRETTPNHEMQQLGIIIDSTLKMWGSARVFAIAAGLAFRESKQANQQLQIWSLGGKKLEILALETKKDTEELLEKMDPALHCGEPLVKAFATHAEKNGKYILITSPHFLNDATVAPFFFKIRDQLSYLITVSAAGHLQMTHFNKNKSKLIKEAHINLNEILNQSHTKRNKQHIGQPGLPAILYEAEFPLYYPTSKIKLHHSNLYQLKNNGVIAVSIDYRLLYWHDKSLGAKELHGQVERGQYCFGEIENTVFMLLIPENKQAIQLYKIDQINLDYHLTKIDNLHKVPDDIFFIKPYFYLKSKIKLFRIDARDGTILRATENDHELVKDNGSNIRIFLSDVKKHLNNGYSTINTAKKIYINKNGRIFSDKKEFLITNNEFYWVESAAATIEQSNARAQEIIKVDHLPNLKFTKFSWKSGSYAIVDSRGLLHLKSHKPHIPEISIIMVVDRPTACWSADGKISGSAYFTGTSGTHKLNPGIFYKNYIQAFIDGLN